MQRSTRLWRTPMGSHASTPSRDQVTRRSVRSKGLLRSVHKKNRALLHSSYGRQMQDAYFYTSLLSLSGRRSTRVGSSGHAHLVPRLRLSSPLIRRSSLRVVGLHCQNIFLFATPVPSFVLSINRPTSHRPLIADCSERAGCYPLKVST